MARIFITLLVVQALPIQWQVSCGLHWTWLGGKNGAGTVAYHDNDKWYEDDKIPLELPLKLSSDSVSLSEESSQDSYQYGFGEIDATRHTTGLAPTSTNVQICKKEGDYSSYNNSIANSATSFQHLVEGSYFWSDKSLLIETVLDDCTTVQLITCPRRSGKSTNLDMISTFVEIPRDEYNRPIPLESSFAYNYFVAGTVKCNGSDVKVIPPPMISKKKSIIARYLGRYPVIYLDLAGIIVDNNLTGFKTVVSELYFKHKYVRSNNPNTVRDSYEVDRYNRMMRKEIDESKLSSSVMFLSEMLFKYHKKNVVIFIDELDHFINQLVFPHIPNKGLNVDSLLTFYQSFMTHSFQMNEYLEKAVLTGVFKICETTGLSSWMGSADLLNLMEPTKFAEFYRLTPTEVEQLLSLAKDPNHSPNADYFNEKKYSLKQVADYYGGYSTYGDSALSSYNTFSVTEFINKGELVKYWAESATMNDFWKLFRFEVFESTISNLYDGVEYLMMIMDIKQIDWDNLKKLRVFFQDTSVNETFSSNDMEAALSLLAFMGYLTPVANSLGGGHFMVRIPNTEIRDWIDDQWSNLFINDSMPQNISVPEHEWQEIKNRLSGFFNSFIVKGRALLDIQHFKKNMLFIFTKADPSKIDASYNKIKDIYNSTQTRFKKLFSIWKELLYLGCKL